MIPVDVAIHRVRRDITLGMLLKCVLLAAFVGSLASPPSFRYLILAGIGGIWIALSITSARSSMLASESPTLIAAGEYDQAEKRIDQSMRAFSLFGPPKLQTLHHLALLRHAQRRWQDAAALCRALLGQRIGRANSLTKPSGLILTESLLELNDLPGAYHAILGLYTQRLSLIEVLNLLPLQLDYEARIGAWAKIFSGAATKVQLAELMPCRPAARVQAMVALAARKCGRGDWADWLRRRAELLADAGALTVDRPILAELWQQNP